MSFKHVKRDKTASSVQEDVISQTEDSNETALAVADKEENPVAQEQGKAAPAAGAALQAVYRQISWLGLQTQRYALRFYRHIERYVRLPFQMARFGLRFVFVTVDRYAFKTYHEAVDEARYLRVEVRSVRKNLKRCVKQSPASVFPVLGHYTAKAFRRHKKLFATLLNTALPIAACVLLATTVAHWGSVTFALEVNYNDQNIGYVANESVYLEAEKLARGRIMSDTQQAVQTAENTASAGSSSVQAVNLSTRSLAAEEEKPAQELIAKPSYKLRLVSIDQLTDADAMSDKLIEHSSSKITNACGVYVDGNFVCAVKNETDAVSVFDKILNEKKTDEANTIADFVEEVSYVQGLYPDNEETVWDAKRLEKKLRSKKAEAVYYTVKMGDTPSGIAQANDLTTKELMAMNPGLTETIHVGDSLLVSNEVNFLRVKIIKTVQRTEEIPFETEENKTSSMYVGRTKTVQEGVNGQRQITEMVTYIDNVPVSTKQVSTKVIKDPVTKKVNVGTKSKSSYSSGRGNAYSSSSSPVYYDTGSVSTRMMWPTPTAHQVSQRYGHNGHKGMDITTSGATGRPIVAAASGTVVYAGWNSTGHGYRVVIDHGNGLQTGYSHCKSGSIRVRVGQKVSQGQQIASIGSTGNSSGPHLHFEVIRNGTRVNPERYI
ncbi:MAG: peptidoglycan DD-metalloendopeptidase family protein [Candidatus Fimivicinus sp.]|nr:peptidoglycan DD-metalloendopeptidase family protein [Oscillospiraceae bacterium]MDY5591583.1 peptidoglycan DD-metalloendopeptidase family protein [Candidatus Fimivicinus sp.]